MAVPFRFGCTKREGLREPPESAYGVPPHGAGVAVPRTLNATRKGGRRVRSRAPTSLSALKLGGLAGCVNGAGAGAPTRCGPTIISGPGPPEPLGDSAGQVDVGSVPLLPGSIPSVEPRAISVRFPRRSQAVHQSGAFAAKHRHIAINDAPYEHVIHARVLMRELVAEVNDAPRLGD